MIKHVIGKKKFYWLDIYLKNIHNLKLFFKRQNTK